MTPAPKTTTATREPPPFSEGYEDTTGEGANILAVIRKAPKKPRPLFLNETSFNGDQRKALSPRLAELANMLEYARPEGSDTEEAFIAKYIDTLPGINIDAYGNRWTRIGKGACNVAWTSHTDTVAYTEGKQAIDFDKDGDFCLDYNSQGECLGADCTAGVWLMRRLILAGKHGLYIFHRKEESGGQGSTWITENTPELVKGIDIMISLDRRGYDSIITEQSTGKTASRTFAVSMMKELGGAFKPDPTGSFTDSAFYSHLIAECTNLSIGYHSCHSTSETLDFVFTDALLVKLMKLDYSKLIVSREPKPRGRAWGSYGSYYNASTYDRWTDYINGSENDTENDYPAEEDLTEGFEDHGLADGNLCVDSHLATLVNRNPEAVAMLLEQWDLGLEEVYEAIADLKAMVGGR